MTHNDNEFDYNEFIRTEKDLYDALYAILTSLRNIGIVLVKDVERAEQAMSRSHFSSVIQDESE